jgi:hypothetical protein
MLRRAPLARSVLVNKVPEGWVLELGWGYPFESTFPVLYTETEEARRAALRWVIQGIVRVP